MKILINNRKINKQIVILHFFLIKTFLKILFYFILIINNSLFFVCYCYILLSNKQHI